MPLVRIDLRRGKPADYKKAICDGIYRAMRETFNVPEEDRFMVVTEHDADNFIFSRTYVGIERSNDLVMIQIAANDTRTVEQKKRSTRVSSRCSAKARVYGHRMFSSIWSKSASPTGRSATASHNMSFDAACRFRAYRAPSPEIPRPLPAIAKA
jgi:phenylpyruvate tautomerase PptA (4-oxalocrotonate tautomerase family)